MQNGFSQVQLPVFQAKVIDKSTLSNAALDSNQELTSLGEGQAHKRLFGNSIQCRIFINKLDSFDGFSFSF